MTLTSFAPGVHVTISSAAGNTIPSILLTSEMYRILTIFSKNQTPLNVMKIILLYLLN